MPTPNNKSNLFQWQTRVKVTGYPTSPEYPITVEELKAQLNIPPQDTTQDAYLDMIIAAATDIAQRYTSRYFLTHSLECRLDHWPWADLRQGLAKDQIYYQQFLELPGIPAGVVNYIEIFYQSNTSTVVDTSKYEVDNFSPDLWARILFYETPSISNIVAAGGIRISYEAGYGTDVADIPKGLIQGLLMLAAYMYENRGDCQSDSQCVKDSGANGYLNMFRVRKL